MKNIKHLTLVLTTVIIGISLLFYIAGAVSQASLSIQEWNESSRGVVSVFWVFAECLAIGITLMEYSTKRY
jgi:hypothetical protein